MEEKETPIIQMNTDHTEVKEKTTNEKIREEIDRCTISEKAKAKLDERMKLLSELDVKKQEFITCIAQMCCVICGATTVRERTHKVRFHPVSHVKENYVTEVIKCLEPDCTFVYELPEEPKKK